MNRITDGDLDEAEEYAVKRRSTESRFLLNPRSGLVADITNFSSPGGAGRIPIMRHPIFTFSLQQVNGRSTVLQFYSSSTYSSRDPVGGPVHSGRRVSLLATRVKPLCKSVIYDVEQVQGQARACMRVLIP